MRSIFILLLYCLFLAASSYSQTLKNCDLIFQVSGKSDFSEAISETTSGENEISFVHVGIIEIADNDSVYVWEASPESGVRRITYDEFLSHSTSMNDIPLVEVKRLNMAIPEKDIMQTIRSHEGEPYDWWYLPDNGKMYCSELVYECFLDSEGKRIFESVPMNFRSEDGTIPDFWISLFKEIDADVPEGLPGTNPNDLSRDLRLVTVKTFRR